MPSITINTIFARWDVLILSFLPALINILILVYSANKLKKTKENVFYSLFVFALVFWQMAEGMVRLSQTASESLQWYRISNVFILLVILFGNLFVFRFTMMYKKISGNILFIFYVLPISTFFIWIQLNLNTVEIQISPNWYWIANPIPNFFTLTISFWIATGALMMIIPLWVYYFKSQKSNRKKQLMLLAIGLSIPIIVGIIVELIFPLLFNLNDIPVTSSLVTTFSIITLIAIAKNKMFDFSPKRHWNSIIESILEGVLIVDNNNNIMYANKAFSNLVGYLPDELLKMNATSLISKDSIEEVEDEVQIITKNGTKLWVLLSNTPYVDTNGNVIGSIGIYTNINQIKITKQNLKIINNELELYVYKASHDLRGPVSTILGLIYIWKMENPTLETEKYLGMIEKSTNKLDEALKSMIKAMKVKEVNLFEDYIEFDPFIDKILEYFSNVEDFDTLTIIKVINFKGKYLTNKFILETVFQNLIENSIKYQRHNLSNSFLKITVNATSSNTIQIIFEDNGCGINPAIQSKVFDMYYRGNRDSKGSGLGLYLVQKSVEKLNGQIFLESKIDFGTTFTFTLPM
jgi:PAS domain S-box-containing protein